MEGTEQIHLEEYMASPRVFDDHYDDIIDLPHPEPKSHPRMTNYQRAAQFSPFAALTGHDAAVREAHRLTDQRIELDETQKTELDEKFLIITRHLQENPEIRITYFVPDQRKEGGAYVSVKGTVKKIDFYEKKIIMHDGTKIDLEQVYGISGEILDNLDFDSK